MNSAHGLLIFGFGGHARSVADVALAAGFSELCFVDDLARDGETFFGFPVIQKWNDALPARWQCFSAAGDNNRRQSQIADIEARGWPIATLIAPTATVGVGSCIARGVLVAQQTHIGPMASIGIGCIVNSGAVIDHECAVGDFTHVSVNATVAGRCRLGRFVMVGAGATLIDTMTVADNVTIGAGAVVCQPLMQAGVYVGVPARKLL